MPIIGTAGHVDHGKSTLVEALTGRDPDRWVEEKDRGLTIDLGFAWTELGGRAVGFVDVPGHERFIKNMLAGVGALDVALFVVAADEGWMPQSEEHLGVLDLLGVHHGVIAITRSDTVEDDLIELAELEIHDRVAGTSLEGWPVVATAAPTGRGISELRASLEAAIDRAGPPPDRGRPRLWVDRAFSIAGAGTVVTGTLLDGTIQRGDELHLWPPGAPVRIRGMQSHETEVDRVVPGSRAALNLAGTDREGIARGAMLGRHGDFRTTKAFLADLRAVRTLEEPLTDRGAYHLHVGSGSWPVRLRHIEDDAETSFATLVRCGHPLPLTMGDRVIFREVGRRAVVAGGVVLDPHPAVARRHALASRIPALRCVADRSADERATVLLDDRGIARPTDIAKDSGGGRPLASVETDHVLVSERAVVAHPRALVQAVRAYQRSNPLRPGAPKASLASERGLDIAVTESIIGRTDPLVDDGATVRTSDFTPQWGPAQEQAWEAARSALMGQGLAVPRASQLGLDDEVLHALLRDKRLIRIDPDLVYLPEQLDELETRLAGMDGEFTVADFRDAMGMTRRHAVPVLEWLDANGWTSRRGDVRTVRRQPSRGPDGGPPP